MRGELMSSRNLFAPILMCFSIAVGVAGFAPLASAASAGKLLANSGESATNNVIEITRRGRGPIIELPIGPSYRYYDYPYYFSRGYYPTHIGNYVYYPDGYSRRSDYTEYSDDSNSARERCDQRFRSFEWETGLYTTYSGYKKLCPYLR